MYNLEDNSISHTDKHSMFICQNIKKDIHSVDENRYDEDYLNLEYSFDPNDYLSEDIDDILDNYSDDMIHFNLMNRKLPNPPQHHDDFNDDFTHEPFFGHHGPGGNERRINCILRRIEVNNPDIFRFLVFRGIPYPTARNLVRRIITLTIRNINCR